MPDGETAGIEPAPPQQVFIYQYYSRLPNNLIVKS